MKKIIIRIVLTVVVLGVLVGGCLLIKTGVKTITTKDNGYSYSASKNLANLEERLVTAEKNISNKITELEKLKEEKQIEYDQLDAEETKQFFKNSQSDAYYESKRKKEKCRGEKLEIDQNIDSLKHEISAFSTDSEIKKLVDNKKNLEKQIEDIKNPSFSSTSFTKKSNIKAFVGVLEIMGGVLIILIQISNIVSIYNKIVKALHKVKNDFANIDVYLKMRWELIPNIVETVKGYSTHESKTLENITKLRNSDYSVMDLNEKVSLNNEINGAVSKIRVLKESYPELKANDSFLDLANQLSKIEDDIANSRINYNRSVMEYNNIIKVFPNNILVNFFKYNEIEMFNISSEEKENVKIEL